jgi:hypothetical protein
MGCDTIVPDAVPVCASLTDATALQQAAAVCISQLLLLLLLLHNMQQAQEPEPWHQCR